MKRSWFLVMFFTLGCTSNRPSDQPQPKLDTAHAATSLATLKPKPSSLKICSFNIQFLGSSKRRKNEALAGVVKSCDVVTVQELVAPPYAGTFPDGNPFNPDKESAQFFKAMENLGYSFVLSEEDTGTGEKNHKNSSATEWWVVFYRPGKVQMAGDLPHGFLADDRTDHPDYERVPYAFAFRSTDKRTDFVLISVHLMPGKKGSERRKQELNAIAAWVKSRKGTERDYVILGDMNIEDKEELAEATPAGFKSLNEECISTNTNVNGPKPYDHVMVNPKHSSEAKGFHVIDLVKAMGVSPDEYNHNQFRALYSDHHPVWFMWRYSRDDD